MNIRKANLLCLGKHENPGNNDYGSPLKLSTALKATRQSDSALRYNYAG